MEIVRSEIEVERVVDWAAMKTDVGDDDYAEGVLNMWLWLIGELEESPGQETSFRRLRG